MYVRSDPYPNPTLQRKVDGSTILSLRNMLTLRNKSLRQFRTLPSNQNLFIWILFRKKYDPTEIINCNVFVSRFNVYIFNSQQNR